VARRRRTKEKIDVHRVPRTATLLPRRSLQAIARTLLHICPLLRRGIILHRYGRAHSGERVLTLCPIWTTRRTLVLSVLENKFSWESHMIATNFFSLISDNFYPIVIIRDNRVIGNRYNWSEMEQNKCTQLARDVIKCLRFLIRGREEELIRSLVVAFTGLRGSLSSSVSSVGKTRTGRGRMWRDTTISSIILLLLLLPRIMCIYIYTVKQSDNTLRDCNVRRDSCFKDVFALRVACDQRR